MNYPKIFKKHTKHICGFLAKIFAAIILTVQLMPGFCQIDQSIPNELKEAIKTYATYASVGSDKVTADLLAVGFSIPDNLKPTWNKFTPVRKIETAYWAAQSKGNGKNMLALLFQNLAQRYRSIESEPVAAYLKSTKIEPLSKIEFGKISTFNLPDLGTLDQQVKATIFCLSKYGDARALGGTRGILKYYFDLPDNLVYEILRGSNDNLEALLVGIGKASIPPSQKERLRTIIEDLQKCYASARSNTVFNKIYASIPLEKMPDGKAITNNSLFENKFFKIEVTGNQAPVFTPLYSTNIDQKSVHQNIYEEYRKYTDKNSDSKSKMFENMSNERHQWGGIVFGNKIVTDLNSIPNKLISVTWIPDQEFCPALNGTLEFRFENENNPKIIAGVLLEDVFAAYRILYSKDIKIPTFSRGEGIGLVASDRVYTYMKTNNSLGPNDSIKIIEKSAWRSLITHPAIANYELGRSLARCDVFPRVQEEIVAKILQKNNLTLEQSAALKRWIQYCVDSNGYKFTDAPLMVQSKNSFLTVRRTDIDEFVNDSYLSFFYTTPSGSSYKQFKQFYLIAPLLANTFYDYDRLNTFSKILAILRWAKEQNADFLNQPLSPTTVKAPRLLHIDRSYGFVEIINVKTESQ